jgi:RNA polymerase sigma factor (sigma-70 family)
LSEKSPCDTRIGQEITRTDPMTEKEKSLITGCVKGEKASWDVFVLQYSALVYHTIRKTFALHHVKVSDDVIEDLYQEFFLAILRDDFKKLRQFRGERGCSLASWVRLVAARLTIDFLRSREANQAPVGENIRSDQRDPAEDLNSREREVLLLEAFEALPERDRLFLQLYYQQSLAPSAIAAILRMSVRAVYTQKSRLLDKLRKILEKSCSL